MNKVILIGRLTKNPELRFTSSNIAVTTFSLAVDRIGSEETDFIDIVVWRKQAENCNKYLEKGSKVAVEGSLQKRSYENKNGEKRYLTEVVAENVQFLDTKSKVQQETNEYNDSSVKTETNALESLDVKIEDSDLPF
jgi:single-strand DNA-binding protein